MLMILTVFLVISIGCVKKERSSIFTAAEQRQLDSTACVRALDLLKNLGENNLGKLDESRQADSKAQIKWYRLGQLDFRRAPEDWHVKTYHLFAGVTVSLASGKIDTVGFKVGWFSKLMFRIIPSGDGGYQVIYPKYPELPPWMTELADQLWRKYGH
ncbi:MAG: hypothetical protein COY66_01330 [Candidatus Kerfeldbacteria bacterium CG_4_10_14_0_8_um_filter_42_10]|uniref:Uncharacterized protein n=1 Tax=Candidatus Kerfeldbacteria bacterium CG_4_10_14_0_8_um_filter_42_10 TaxID=2014248 RepID=A0A2M7RL32_9BACT|nr:MAG: hypothetical protein COY66_01330 [Candidatus Kerfeldbacteria bacterium CG_4_10_14_0_8_um_filter_42_10]